MDWDDLLCWQRRARRLDLIIAQEIQDSNAKEERHPLSCFKPIIRTPRVISADSQRTVMCCWDFCFDSVHGSEAASAPDLDMYESSDVYLEKGSLECVTIHFLD